MRTTGTAPRTDEPEYAAICVRLWPVSEDPGDDYSEDVLIPALDVVIEGLIDAIKEIPGQFYASASFVTDVCSHEHYWGTMSDEDWHVENPDEAGKIAVAVAASIIHRAA